MQGPKDEIDPLDALRAELARLRQKRGETDDPDIVAALDLRIAQIEGELPAEPAPEFAAAEPEPDPEPLPPPPTPKEAEEAEALVRQARVEKMRNNRQASTDLLKRAAEIAPGSPTVLEALGDDFAERKKMVEARDTYKKAFALDPKNVGLERKFGNAVLLVEMAGSLDDQMRRNLSDSVLLSTEDQIASLPMAIILTAVFPGSGHLVLGQTTKGAWLLGGWILSGIWLMTMFGDLAKLLALGAGGGREQPNLLVMVPLLIMAVIYITALASLKAVGEKSSRKPPARPKPPVDLPFE